MTMHQLTNFACPQKGRCRHVASWTNLSHGTVPQHSQDVCTPAGAPTWVRSPDGSAVVRRIIASDNSCLFNAVGYIMEGSRAQAPKLRCDCRLDSAVLPHVALCSIKMCCGAQCQHHIGLQSPICLQGNIKQGTAVEPTCQHSGGILEIMPIMLPPHVGHRTAVRAAGPRGQARGHSEAPTHMQFPAMLLLVNRAPDC